MPFKRRWLDYSPTIPQFPPEVMSSLRKTTRETVAPSGLFTEKLVASELKTQASEVHHSTSGLISFSGGYDGAT